MGQNEFRSKIDSPNTPCFNTWKGYPFETYFCHPYGVLEGALCCFYTVPFITASQPGPSPLLTPWLVNHWFPLIRPLLNPYFPGFNMLGAGALTKTSARTFSAKVLMKKVHHHLTILRQDIRQ